MCHSGTSVVACDNPQSTTSYKTWQIHKSCGPTEQWFRPVLLWWCQHEATHRNNPGNICSNPGWKCKRGCKCRCERHESHAMSWKDRHWSMTLIKTQDWWEIRVMFRVIVCITDWWEIHVDNTLSFVAKSAMGKLWISHDKRRLLLITHNREKQRNFTQQSKVKYTRYQYT